MRPRSLRLLPWAAALAALPLALAFSSAPRLCRADSVDKSLKELKKVSNTWTAIRNDRPLEVIAYHGPKAFPVNAPAVEVRPSEIAQFGQAGGR